MSKPKRGNVTFLLQHGLRRAAQLLKRQTTMSRPTLLRDSPAKYLAARATVVLAACQRELFFATDARDSVFVWRPACERANRKSGRSEVHFAAALTNARFRRATVCPILKLHSSIKAVCVCVFRSRVCLNELKSVASFQSPTRWKINRITAREPHRCRVACGDARARAANAPALVSALPW